MKLRGAFNPKVQLFCAVATIGVYFLTIVTLWHADWAQLDLRVAPFILLAGTLLGLHVGASRYRALMRVLPEVEGRFYLSQRGVLSRDREGENALTLQRNSWAVAFLAWLAASTQSRLFYVSLASFILGSYLTGQLVPFVRLWLTLRKTGGTPAPPLP